MAKKLPIKESLGGRGDLGTHQSSGKFPRIGSGPMSEEAFLLRPVKGMACILSLDLVMSHKMIDERKRSRIKVP